MHSILSGSQRTGCVLAVLLLTVLAGMVVPITASSHAVLQQSNQPNQSNQSEIHTLIVRSAGQPATYSITINGTLTADTSEQSDTIEGNRMTGSVGGRSETTNNTDTTDVIKYTGYIVDFESNTSQIRVTLDNSLIDISVLSENHIVISHTSDQQTGTNTSQIRYSFSVTGQIAGEENAEPDDEPSNATTVTGQLSSSEDRDGFYYSGEITSSSFSSDVRITINGQSVSPENLSQFQTRTPTSTDRDQSTQQNNTNRSQTHTLIIKPENGSVEYTVSVSGTLTIQANEPSDRIDGQTVTGSVGGSRSETGTDTRDIIKFTGQLQTLDYNGGTIRVIFDGERLDLGTTESTDSGSGTAKSTDSRDSSSDSSSIWSDFTIGFVIGSVLVIVGGYIGFMYSQH